ncbi:hypothetical protein ACFQ7W_00745 [Streptomyces niveus]|uniref:hypothetical protein n=1 Tax=Streptomyces niveus TaxID=193462 RepID=UPI003682BB55
MSVDTPRWHLDTLLNLAEMAEAAPEWMPVGLYHRIQLPIDPQLLATCTRTRMCDVPPALRGPNWTPRAW